MGVKMNVSMSKIERSQVVLNIEVEKEEMEQAIQQAYRRQGAKATIPGFRKGKAPTVMLERYFGREALVEDAADHLLPELYDKAIKDNGVDAIAQPKIEILKIEPLSFKATVPVRPTVELADYHQIRFVSEAVDVTEEEVTKAIEQIRYDEAPWEPVERPVIKGDLLVIDVEGSVQGKNIVNDKGRLYLLSPETTPSFSMFAEHLEGAQKGEERVFAVTLPPESGEYGGQECNFKITVNEIKQKKLADLGDEFAKSLGQGLENLDSLRERVRDNLRLNKEEGARTNLEQKAISALVELARVEFPDVIAENQIDQMIDERKQYLGGEKGIDNYLKSINKTEEELRNELKPAAEQMVIRSLVLQKFAELEGIEVSAAELDSEMQHILQKTTDEKVRSIVDSSRTRQSLERRLSLKKTFDRLIEIVTASGEPPESPEISATSAVKEEVKENEKTAE